MPAIPSCVLSDKDDELIQALRTARTTTDADTHEIHMNRRKKALNAFLDVRSNLCYTDANVEQDRTFDSDGHRAGYSAGKSYRAIVHPLQRADTTSVQAGLLR